MNTYRATVERKPLLTALVLAIASLFAALGRQLLRAWDHIQDVPTEFSFTLNPDKSKVHLVMYCYDRKDFFLQPVGIIMDRGHETINRYHGRSIRRIMKAAKQAGFHNFKYIEKPAQAETLWACVQY